MDWELQKATSDEFEFLWDLHTKTMRDYVERTWGWDETVQYSFFKDKFVAEDYLLVLVGGERRGCVQYNWHISELRLHLIEILPEHQNQGLGSAIIANLQQMAFEHRRDLALRTLKCNPANRLFLKLGFVQISETDTHLSLIWRHRQRLSLGDSG